jgi:hypothetical protein
MKKYYFIIIVALILGLVLTGCTLLSNIGQTPTSEQSGITYLTKSPGSLVGLWHFDDDALDSSGNNNDGTVYGANWVDGKFDKALNFDGDDDYVDFGSGVTGLITGDYTVEAWIKPASLDSGRHTVMSFSYMELGHNAGKVYFWQAYDGSWGKGYKYTSPTVLLDVTEFSHIVGVFHKDAGVDLYVDGNYIGSGITRTGTSVNIFGNTYAGDWYWIPPGGGRFDGIIDEVRIWNKALSGDDIEESYSLGAIEFTKKLTAVSPEPDDWVVGDMPIVPIDTVVTFTMPITVNNKSLLTLNGAWVKDRLGAELEVVPFDNGGPFYESIGNATYDTKGKSEKVFIDWDFEGTLSVNAEETLIIEAQTDINPGGKKDHQEYTSTGTYELNSGATLTFHVTVAGEEISLVMTTDGLLVQAVGEEDD